MSSLLLPGFTAMKQETEGTSLSADRPPACCARSPIGHAAAHHRALRNLETGAWSRLGGALGLQRTRPHLSISPALEISNP